MGWLPKFLNVWPAAVAAAIAIPALITLYFLKLRRREFAVPSTILWRKAVQELQVNAPFQRLRKNLLLFLQLLLLAALIFALARPVMHYTPGAGPRSIILIDRSAPMSAVDAADGQTRLDVAKKRAKDLVDTLGEKGVAMVIAFDDSAQIVQPFTSDQRTLKNAIDSIGPTDRLTFFQSAYRLADAQAAAAEETNHVSVQVRGKPDVYLFSSGRAQDGEKAVLEGNLHYNKIGSDTSGNIAIVAMSARRDYQEPTHVEVFVRLANFGPNPASGVPVQLLVDGHITRSVSVNLLPDRYTQEQRDAAAAQGFDSRDSIVFPTLDLTESAVIKVEQLQAEGDTLGTDDSAVVVVPPPKILSVLLVTDGNWFLDNVLQAQKLKILDRMFPQEYLRLPTADGGGKKTAKPYDVIIFDRCDDLRPQDVPRTGAAIYFGCVPPGLELKPELDDSGSPVYVDNNPVLDWKRDHPILRHLNLAKMYVARTERLLPTLNSVVLIQGEAAPLMILHRQDRAFHLVVPFDLWQSDWPLQRTFPVFFFQTLQYLALGQDLEVKPSYQPGVALRIPRFDLDKAASPAPKEISLNGPMGVQRIKIPPTGDFVLPELDKVGLYTTSPPIPQYEKIAVNLLDSTESNILPADQVPGVAGETVASAPIQSRLELWWWLVAAVLPLLLVEWWVYTRRVHL